MKEHASVADQHNGQSLYGQVNQLAGSKRAETVTTTHS